MPCFPRALVLAHFDRDGIVDAHVLRSLKTYRDVFDTIILVTTSSLSNKKDVTPLVDKLIERTNIGLDFYSWKVGLENLSSPSDYFEVAFCNDSVYGPLYDLEQALLSPNVRDADFWGMSSSAQVRPHVQSYFFAMRYPLFADGAAQRFWQTVNALPDKDSIIDTYETRMSEWFRQRGYQIRSVYAPPSGEFRNPTLQLWRDVFAAGCPYLKVALLQLHSNEDDVREILGYVKKISKYPIELIEKHMVRTMPATSNLRIDPCSG